MKVTKIAAAMILGAMTLSWTGAHAVSQDNANENNYVITKRHKKIRSAARKAAKEPRNYHALLTSKQDKTLGKLLLTLGNENLARIFKKRDSLKTKGDTLRRVHPFRFLEKAYSEDSYVAAMCSIVERPLVWSDFKRGLYDSLTDEYAGGNLVQFIPEFARNIKMEDKIDHITQRIHEQDWDGLMKVLNSKPRAGQPNRYDF